ncbi:hypothetical protein [Prochlorothrix hollandica]|uniref:hypothetical protein n=1 Tax=Prochlorothrix hollandica TaxID=1223 RepID=UPI00034A049E|nr:hypothetical protein [Prochlorothrix hollandica]
MKPPVIDNEVNKPVENYPFSVENLWKTQADLWKTIPNLWKTLLGINTLWKKQPTFSTGFPQVFHRFSTGTVG